MEKEITIYDIAEKLGLSASTVSRALKNNPIINEETRKKVNEFAKANGYRSNAFASNLRTQSTNTLGVIVPKLDSNFMSACISGMEEVASHNGYNLLIMQSHESKVKEEENSTVLFNKRVDGLLVSLTKESDNLNYLERFQTKNVPVVFFDRVPNKCNQSCFVIDNEKMAYEATNHLIEQGCKKIVHVTNESQLNVYIDRAKGFENAIANSKSCSGEIMRLPNLNLEAGKNLAAKIIELQVDGLFVSNDIVAAGCMIQLQDLGVKIPNDIAVVGFNNDQVAQIVRPNLTSVNYSGKDAGRNAMSSLISSIKSKSSNRETNTLKTELIIRESSQRNK